MAKKKPEKKEPKEKAKKQSTRPATDGLTDEVLENVAGGKIYQISNQVAGGTKPISPTGNQDAPGVLFPDSRRLHVR